MGRLSKTEHITRELLKWYLPDLTYHYNIRPWDDARAKPYQRAQARRFGFDLEGLEGDIYIEEWRTIIEVQGAQHYRNIPFFTRGDTHIYLDQISRDSRKVELCQRQNVTLYHLTIFDLQAEKFEPFIKRLMKDRGMLEQYHRATRPRVLFREAERLSRAKVPPVPTMVTPGLFERLWGWMRGTSA